MQVKDAMSGSPKVINEHMTLAEAAQKMLECDCGYLPVGDHDRLTGALTDRDIVVRAIARGLDPMTTEAGEVMTRTIHYCMETDDLEKAAEKMQKEKVRRLAVLNANKRITGILTVGNIATKCRDKDLLGAVEYEVCASKKAA